MADPIRFFRGEHAFLSNFFPRAFVFHLPGGASSWKAKTAEHAFQACKGTTTREVGLILNARTAKIAKQRGFRCQLRADWEQVKLRVMEMVVWDKFADPELRSRLLATGDAHLEEGNSWGDTTWGVVAGVGENHLGKTLMRARARIRFEQACLLSNIATGVSCRDCRTMLLFDRAAAEKGGDAWRQATDPQPCKQFKHWPTHEGCVIEDPEPEPTIQDVMQKLSAEFAVGGNPGEVADGVTIRGDGWREVHWKGLHLQLPPNVRVGVGGDLLGRGGEMTVNEARDALLRNFSLKQKVEQNCPCCGRRAVSDARGINQTMARALIAICRAWCAQEGLLFGSVGADMTRWPLDGGGWIRTDKAAPSLAPFGLDIHNTGRDFTQLKFYGMLEEKARNEGDLAHIKGSAHWRPTQHGLLFAEGRVSVPNKLTTFNATLALGDWMDDVTGEWNMVSIRDLKGWNYDRYMRGGD